LKLNLVKAKSNKKITKKLQNIKRKIVGLYCFIFFLFYKKFSLFNFHFREDNSFNINILNNMLFSRNKKRMMIKCSLQRYIILKIFSNKTVKIISAKIWLPIRFVQKFFCHKFTLNFQNLLCFLRLKI